MTRVQRQWDDLPAGTPVRHPETGERGVYHGEAPASTYTHIVTVPYLSTDGMEITTLKNWKTIEPDPDGCVFDWIPDRLAPEGTEWVLMDSGHADELRATATRGGVAVPRKSWEDIATKWAERFHELNTDPVVVPEIKAGMWLQAYNSGNDASVRYVSHQVKSQRRQWVTFNFNGTPIEYSPDDIGVAPAGDFFECDMPSWGPDLLALLGITETVTP